MEKEEIETRLELLKGKQKANLSLLGQKREMVIRVLAKPRRIGGTVELINGEIVVTGGELVTPEFPTEEEILREMNSLDDMVDRFNRHERLSKEEIETKRLMIEKNDGTR